MQEFFFIGELATFSMAAVVYFIHIHVALGTASCLPHYQRKIISPVSLSISHHLLPINTDLFFGSTPASWFGDGGCFL